MGVYKGVTPSTYQMILFSLRSWCVTHINPLHGGLGLTMAEVREKYSIPRLRKLRRKVVKSCWGCKRFQAVAQATPPPGLLPMERTEGSGAFEIIGVDFAGPIKYRKSPRIEGKAYLVLAACQEPYTWKYYQIKRPRLF